MKRGCPQIQELDAVVETADSKLAGSPQGSHSDSLSAGSQAHSIVNTVEIVVQAPVLFDKLAASAVELASQEQNSIVQDTVVAQPVVAVKQTFQLLQQKFVVKKIVEHFVQIAGPRMKIRSNEVAPLPKYQ
ncbi:MAG: hypothetical protein ACQESU_01470 [Halobacteriota archaeon]